MPRTPIDPKLFKRERFSGNPPHAPYVFGFVVRFRAPGALGMSGQRPATPEERAWLHAHDYKFSGGKWCRPDRKPARHAPEPADS